MNYTRGSVSILTCCALALGTPIHAGPAQDSSELRLDPSLFVSLRQCREIAKALAGELYPGWDFASTPVLFYRPNVQEILINFPHKPRGFVVYTGRHPLGKETLYVRNDKTTLDLDDQNTSIDLEGVRVLVVADPFSRMRNQLRSVFSGRPKEEAAKYLDEWRFIPSPYDEIQTILHESFHVHQHRKAPRRFAKEAIVAKYPLLDPANNALYALERRALKEALLGADAVARREATRRFVAIRVHRQARLEPDCVLYENLNEYVEGTAKYVEYKFLQTGDKIEPIRQMYDRAGFQGFQGVLAKRYRERIGDVVRIADVADNRFGNRFGSGPLRYRLYELGACQALLLDEFSPTWKEKIFKDGVFLCDLLRDAVGLNKDELAQLLDDAKRAYEFDKALISKQAFQEEGQRFVRAKLAAILETKDTLVSISYDGLGKDIGISYTPFGVTQITKTSAIYDLVPINVRFKAGAELRLKQVTPTIIDKGKKTITFAVATPAAKIVLSPGNRIECGEFVLTGDAMEITREGGKVMIRMK